MRTARWEEAFSPGNMHLSRRRRSLSPPEGMGPCASVFGTKHFFYINVDSKTKKVQDIYVVFWRRNILDKYRCKRKSFLKEVLRREIDFTKVNKVDRYRTGLKFFRGSSDLIEKYIFTANFLRLIRKVRVSLCLSAYFFNHNLSQLEPEIFKNRFLPFYALIDLCMSIKLQCVLWPVSLKVPSWWIHRSYYGVSLIGSVGGSCRSVENYSAIPCFYINADVEPINNLKGEVGSFRHYRIA